MAESKEKPQKKQIFSIQGFDIKAFKQTEAYVQAIDAIYNEAVKEFAAVAAGVNFNPDKPFSFADYPQARSKAQGILKNLVSKTEAIIKKGSREQWLYANKKNDAFLAYIMNTSMVPAATLAKYQDKNLDALEAFQKRKISGMSLSKKVWNYSGQIKKQMELGIDIALGEGKSAAQLSRDLRQYLIDPDKLFRKVRDKHGNLHISKNAEAFHPGQGKYRSSYKNAMRLTRSEINMAYRVSDQLRWQQMDFIIGYEVKLSNNHTTLINGVPTPFKDICDELAGKYPKWFKWTAWHPQCRCHVIPILRNREESKEDRLNRLRAAWNDTEYKKFESKDMINDVPENFKQWIADNAENSENWSSQPYWVRDNFHNGVIAGGIKFATVKAAQKNTFAPLATSSIEADNMLRTKAGEVWSKASQQEREALYYYTLNEYSTINYSLYAQLQHKNQASIDISNMISRSKYDHDITLRRGCKPDDLSVFGLKQSDLVDLEALRAKAIGKKGVYENYVSTGAAEGKGMNRDIEYIINAQAGTEMIYTEPFSGNGFGAELKWDGKTKQETFSSEQEVLINQGYEYEIISIDKYTNSKGKEITRFYLKTLTRKNSKLR